MFIYYPNSLTVWIHFKHLNVTVGYINLHKILQSGPSTPKGVSGELTFQHPQHTQSLGSLWGAWNHLTGRIKEREAQIRLTGRNETGSETNPGQTLKTVTVRVVHYLKQVKKIANQWNVFAGGRGRIIWEKKILQ